MRLGWPTLAAGGAVAGLLYLWRRHRLLNPETTTLPPKVTSCTLVWAAKQPCFCHATIRMDLSVLTPAVETVAAIFGSPCAASVTIRDESDETVDAASLQALYVIHQRRNDASEPDANTITRIVSEKAAALRLRNQAFRPRFVRGLGQEGPNFIALARLQSSIPMAVLPLPSGIVAMQSWLLEQNLLTAVAEAEGPSAQDEKKELRP